MGLDSDLQLELVNPRSHGRRQIVGVIVFVVVIISLLLAVLSQFSLNPSIPNQPNSDPSALGLEKLDGGGITRIVITIAIILGGTIAILASITQISGVSVRDLISSRAAKKNIEEFPFYVVRDFDRLLDYFFPDPKTPLLSDRNIRYLPQVSDQTDAAFDHNRFILIRGRSKTGKTREMCELLRRWWYTGPTVLVARNHVGLYPPYLIPENLPIRNLVLIFDDIDRYLGDHAALKRLDGTLQYFQNICHDRGELRVVATVRQEEAFWEKIDFDQSTPPWDKFELVQLQPLSPEKAQQAIGDLARMADVTIAPSLVEEMARKNDGTFLNLALAFRGWLGRGVKTINPEDIRMFEGALKNTWRRRYEILAAAHPTIKPIYAAINLFQSNNLPLRPYLINAVATEMAMGKWVLSTFALVDRFQNWVDMSPLFNNDRIPTRKMNWLFGSLLGILYSLMYGFLRFVPYRVQSSIINGVTTNPISLTLIYGVFVFLLVVLVYLILVDMVRYLVSRRIRKMLDLLITSEVPIHGNELRPYDNQFEGNGHTFSWEIADFSGEVISSSFQKNVSLRIMNRYLFIAERLRLNGEFSAARCIASVAQRLSSRHPKPLLLLAKIDMDEGNYRNAIRILQVAQHLYRRSNNSVFIQEYQAVGHYFMQEYNRAEDVAQRLLDKAPKLLISRWILGLSQLIQGKIDLGLQNCRKAASIKKPLPVEIPKTWENLDQKQRELVNESIVSVSKRKKKERLKEYKLAKMGLTGCSVIIVFFAILFSGLLFLTNNSISGQVSIIISNTLVAVFPDAPVALVARGDRYRNNGDYDKALADLNKAIELDPSNIQAYLARGYVYIELEEFENALADYDEALHLAPENLFAHFYRAYIYYQQEDFEKSMAEMNETIRIGPRNGRLYRNRGNLYFRIGDYDHAVADYVEAIRLNPKDDLSYYSRAYTYKFLDQCEKAIEDYSTAINLNSQTVEYYEERAECYGKLGDHEKQLADINEVIRIVPNDNRGYYLRVSFYVGHGDYEKAIADLNEIIRMQPADAYAYSRLANVYDESGEYEKAIATYTKAIFLDPSNTFLYFSRGYMYKDHGEYEKAIADLTEVIRLAPTTYFYQNRGELYFEIGEYQKAIADLTEAIRLESEAQIISTDSYATRADYYFKMGDYEKAISDYSEIIRKNLEDVDIFYLRGKAYQAIGKQAEAEADFRIYTNLVGQEEEVIW